MSEHTQLPDQEYVQSFFAGLFGDDVLVKSREGDVDLSSSTVIVTYTNDESHVVRALVCDIPFANGTGGALSMIPRSLVEDSNKDQTIPENIMSNLHEVFNICANLFSENLDANLRLGDVADPSHAKQTELKTTCETKSDSISFDVDLGNYGVGVMTLMDVPN